METQKLQLKAFAQKAGDGRITVIASDETVDRSGEVVPIDAWDLANFRQSPRLLIDHDYSVKSVVGLAENIRVQGRQLLFDPLFHEITQAARETKQMVEQGFLDTVSVGFLRREEGGRILNELLEVSFVAVPCNPNARTLSVKDIGPDEEKAVEAFVAKTQEPIPTEESQKPEEQEESKTVESEVKAGRVISEKNRQTLQSAIEYMTQASGALQQLLDAAEAQGSEGKVHDGDGSSKQRSSDAGSDEEVFKQWLLMKQVLRAVNTATSDALAKSKLFIRSK
jgi:hypothetical protein